MYEYVSVPLYFCTSILSVFILVARVDQVLRNIFLSFPHSFFLPFFVLPSPSLLILLEPYSGELTSQFLASNYSFFLFLGEWSHCFLFFPVSRPFPFFPFLVLCLLSLASSFHTMFHATYATVPSFDTLQPYAKVIIFIFLQNIELNFAFHFDCSWWEV